MVNFVTEVELKFSDDRPTQRAAVFTHELFGAPAYFLGFVVRDEASIELARKMVAIMRRRGITGRCQRIRAEEGEDYCPLDYPMSSFLETRRSKARSI